VRGFKRWNWNKKESRVGSGKRKSIEDRRETKVNPLDSNRSMISPIYKAAVERWISFPSSLFLFSFFLLSSLLTKPLCTPSGLMAMKVRSVGVP